MEKKDYSWLRAGEMALARVSVGCKALEDEVDLYISGVLDEIRTADEDCCPAAPDLSEADIVPNLCAVDLTQAMDSAIKVRSTGQYPWFHYRMLAALILTADDSIRSLAGEADFDALKREISKAVGRTEADVIYGVAQQCVLLVGGTPVDSERLEIIKRAYTAGFNSEKKYRGCAQGTLNALSELTGVRNDDLFRAATGFSGGMALCGDGVCGGYSGGLMFLSYLRGRDFERIPIDGDKENQYFAYECAQLLHDRFIACYGSPVCRCIHEGMFSGEHFTLRTKPRRDEFEAAGAHTVVCTTVVGLACAWVVEIMLDKGLYLTDRH